jgi:glycerate kinase
LSASTFGLGELVLAAAGRQPAEIVIGLGGSATVDGGIGMAAALGWSFTNERGEVLEPLPPSLNRVAHVHAPAEPLRVPVRALVDVQTLLFGAAGAARVFGPQKGATSAEVELLDRGLENFAGVIERDLGIRVNELAGGGAAGGLGAAIRVFLAGEITPGSDWVLHSVGFTDHVRSARLLVTAEGSYDAQSELGKITGTMIARARGHHVPVLLVAGRVEGALPEGVRAVTPEGGQVLREDDLTVLARSACSELLPL